MIKLLKELNCLVDKDGGCINGKTFEFGPYREKIYIYGDGNKALEVTDNINIQNDIQHRFSSIGEYTKGINDKDCLEIIDYILKHHNFPSRDNKTTVCIQTDNQDEDDIINVMINNGFIKTQEHVCYGPLFEKKIH